MDGAHASRLMPPVNPQPGKSLRARRRAVRIVKRRQVFSATTISLALAVGAAVVLPILWRMWRADDTSISEGRTFTEWETQWKCEAGHYLFAAGQYEPRSCWKCGEPAYPVSTYVCPVHDAFEVNVVFTPGEDGQPVVSRIRLVGRDWFSAEEGVRCPRCGRQLEYSDDPLLGVKRRLKRGD